MDAKINAILDQCLKALPFTNFMCQNVLTVSFRNFLTNAFAKLNLSKILNLHNQKALAT